MYNKLYSDSFFPPVLDSAKILTNDNITSKYSPEKRLWQGCPTIELTPKGKLWAGWYSGGTREPHEDNYNLLVYSNDDGVTWSDPILIIDSISEIFLRAMDIQLWLDPFDRLWVFWTQTRDSSFKNENGDNLAYTDDVFGLWAITTNDIESDNPAWSAPFRISDGFLRCKPTALSNGRWLICAYDWLSNRFAYTISDDNGETWSRKYGAIKTYEGRCFDEHMVIQRNDDSLWSLSRTNQGRLAQTFSFDNGETWTPVGFSMMETPSSRFWIGRSHSGRMLMINHYNFTGRSHLTAMLSSDEGETWEHKLLIDERDDISYPDVVVYPDGNIKIIYDRGRTSDKEIILYSTSEDNIIKNIKSESIVISKV